MNKLINLFGFQKEADLLDSKTYIIKSFLAVATAYAFASRQEFISKDMISVLFGLMLTLEPVTLTGIRHGWNQVYATILGALSTAAIISILGINLGTISLSVAFTLYVCLKINWREVSPVAIFTSIYMTQYIQTTPAGEISLFLTVQLRLMALGTGVIIAILFNLIFSFISYRKMTYKRIAFLLRSLVGHMEKTLVALKTKNKGLLEENQREMSQTFNNIDWVHGFLKDMEEEDRMKYRIFGTTGGKGKELEEVVMNIRSLCHLNFDMNLRCLWEKQEWIAIHQQEEVFAVMQQMICALNDLKDDFQSREIKKSYQNPPKSERVLKNIENARIIENLIEMGELIVSLERYVLDKEIMKNK